MMAEEPEPRPAITKVWAKNFRSIEYAELELDPLTVLVGPNASGKSNLLDVIGFLSDAVRDGLETAVNRRGGIDSIGRRGPDGTVLGPELCFRFDSSRDVLEYGFELSTVGQGNYKVLSEFATLVATNREFGSCEVEIVDGHMTRPGLTAVTSPEPSNEIDEEGSVERFRARLIEHFKRGFDYQNLHLMTGEHGGVTSNLMWFTTAHSAEGGLPYSDLHFALQRENRVLPRARLYHIFPNLLREPRKLADSHPLMSDGENLGSVLRDMIQKESRFLPDLKHALNYAVPGITDIRVSRAGSFQVVELKHDDGRNGRGTWFDLSYESDGTIRLLAMLTALFQEPSLPLIGLEEPELAIHPGAMAVLAENMVEASLRGQVVVATHSPDLIDRMPVESLRAVSAESGSTKVGRIASHQLKSVREGLFSAGEIHSMMGLCPEDVGA